MMEIERKPMSAILKEMALAALRAPDSASQPAAAAALYMAYVAWQRANGYTVPYRLYKETLAEMKRVCPEIRKEMKSSDARKLIAELVAYKKLRFPNDKRNVVKCWFLGDKVRAEWTE